MAKAFESLQPDPKTWIMVELNRGRTVTAVAHELGMARNELTRYMRDAGIRKVVWWTGD